MNHISSPYRVPQRTVQPPWDTRHPHVRQRSPEYEPGVHRVLQAVGVHLAHHIITLPLKIEWQSRSSSEGCEESLQESNHR